MNFAMPFVYCRLDGYYFWLNKLEEFGGDFRRAEMVKSFLVSSEYRAALVPQSRVRHPVAENS